MTDTPLLSAIYLYPIKSCRGISVSSAQLNDWGLRYDRNWMLVTPNGKFITQREVPALALVETAIDSEFLKLSAPGVTPLQLPLSEQAGDVIEVVVWRDRCQAIDQGDEAAAWFSQFLHLACRLVRIGSLYSRPVNPAFANSPAQVSFADGFPFLMISEASLADLNRRLAAPIPMNRFRPNFVVANCSAYAEDSWKQVQINQIRFDVVKPCERCIITTTDQTTGTRFNKEPLVTLATYRGVKGGVIFGQNLVHLEKGEVHVGDAVQVNEKA
jgi:uncharacterized protein